MKTLTILSSFSNLAEAAVAFGDDYSYNPAIAQRAIIDADQPCKRARELGITPATAAYITQAEDGSKKLLYTYGVSGVRMLREFTPFISCLDNSGLQVCIIDTEKAAIFLTEATVSKEAKHRRSLADLCAMSTSLFYM